MIRRFQKAKKINIINIILPLLIVYKKNTKTCENIQISPILKYN